MPPLDSGSLALEDFCDGIVGECAVLLASLIPLPAPPHSLPLPTNYPTPSPLVLYTIAAGRIWGLTSNAD